jgi:hypothetical protein
LRALTSSSTTLPTLRTLAARGRLGHSKAAGTAG